MNRRRTLRVAALPAAALLLAAAARAPDPPLGGPIADFWNQVKRDWARKIPGLRHGTDQTAQWVSLVYGADGEDEVLADLFEGQMNLWAKWQRRAWMRSEFWKARYEDLDRDGFYASRALRRNLVVMGTAATNPMLREMTEGSPFRIEEGTVWIGPREYRGGSLVLGFIRPNPLGDGSYALVIASTSDEALLDLQALPMGPTDYILYRGRHRLEAGFLDWADPSRLELDGAPEIRPDHDGWWSVSSGGTVVRFDPAEFPEAAAHRYADAAAAARKRAVRYFGLDSPAPPTVYLYGSADAKLRHSGMSGPLDVDLAERAVHRVRDPGLDGAHWPETMVTLWSAWGPTELRGLLLALAVLPDGGFEGRSLDGWAAHLAAAGRLRPVEDLMVPGPPWRDGEGDRALESLALASFLADVEASRGRGALEAYYRQSRSGSFRSAFREVTGTSLGRAERAWRDRLPALEVPEADAPHHPPEEAAAHLDRGRQLFRERRDAEARAALERAVASAPSLAEAHLLLARLAFRGGEDAEAIEEAGRALAGPAIDPEVTAWAQVTRGRAHAVRGELLSARLALTDPAVARGPEAPRLLADLWLENLGLSPNRAAAARYLREQAEIDLLSYDWDRAEQRALQILASDPGDPAGHHLLARIRVQKFSYWFDFANFFNELFPTSTPHDPLQYYYLLQSAHRESMKATYLESGEMSSLELDRRKSPKIEAGWVPQELYPALREPAYMTQASEEVVKGRAFLLAGDYRQAASHLRAALQLVIPVSDARAWALYLLAQAEIELGEIDAARAHLDEARRIVRVRSLKADIEGELESLGEP
ncbi:MAG: tetratricopeptide repeat protein [Acidobacteriota bacterium]|jgi:tetratricopeptide (TPR) repeat protein